MKTVADIETKVYCLRIVCRDHPITLRMALYPTWLKMSNDNYYYSELGVTVSDFDTSLAFTPPIVELEGSFADHAITREDLMRGVYRGAKAYLFATSWLNPVENEEPLGMFLMDLPKISGNVYKIELRHIIDALDLTPELTYVSTCLNTFCDESPYGEPATMSYCGLDAATYTETGVLDTVTGIYYYASDRAEADGYFEKGYIRFNALVDGEYQWTEFYEVIAFSAGTFTLFETPLYNGTQILAGTEYEARAGCNKTLAMCRDRFDNVTPASGGFFGFPNIPNSQQAGKLGGRG